VKAWREGTVLYLHLCDAFFSSRRYYIILRRILNSLGKLSAPDALAALIEWRVRARDFAMTKLKIGRQDRRKSRRKGKFGV
jgi:hypothetical protein